MSNYYIYNKSNRLLYVQDSAGKIVFSLSPKKCSLKAYSEEFISDNLSIQSYLKLGYVMLTELKVSEPIERVKENMPGQKFKNGSIVYTKDRARLELTIMEFLPSSNSYKLKINKTGAIIVLAADALSSSKVVQQESSNDEEKEDNVSYIDKEAEISSSVNSAVSIVRTEPVEAKAVDANDRILDSELDTSKVEIVDSNKFNIPQSPVSVNEDTFIIKADNQKFAKEVSEAEIVQNTQKEITNALKQAVNTVSETKKSVSKPVNNNTENQTVQAFNTLDNRVKKMSIARMKDINKLTMLAESGDELTQKLATARLAKLNGK